MRGGETSIDPNENTITRGAFHYLPRTYQELSYLQADTTSSYIRLGSGNDSIFLDAWLPRGVTGKIWSGYGLDGSGDGGSFSAAITSDTTISTSIGGSTTGGDFIIPTLPEDLVLEMTTTQAKVNLSIAASWTGRDIDPSTFSLYIGAVGSGVAGMKVREVRLGNTHLYPARRISDDVLGLSDTAGNFYAVSGTWTAGNIVPSVLKQNNLHNIYLAWEDREAGDTKTFSMLLNLLNGYLADGWTPRTYHTIDPNTKQINTGQGPRLYGEVKINEGFYADLLDKFNIAETTDITISGVVWKRAKISNFGGLYLFYNPDLTWIRFEDPEVERLCVEKWDTSGDGGLGLGEAQAVTGARNSGGFCWEGSIFTGNTKIEYFDEFRYFTGVTGVYVKSWSASNAPFYNCTSLKKITLPPTCTSAGYGLFYNCSKLEEITMPATFSFGSGGGHFTGCSSLKRVNIPNMLEGYITGYTFESGTSSAFGYASNEVDLYLNGESLREVTVSSTVTSIKDRAFYNLRKITSLNLPESLTSIGQYAFYNCTELSGELPESLTSIEQYTFYNCTGLSGELILLDSLTTIGQYAFYGCTGLSGDLILPSTLTSIGNNAFSGCTNLSGIVHLPDTLNMTAQYKGNPVFNNCKNLTIFTGSGKIPNCFGSVKKVVYEPGCTLSSVYSYTYTYMSEITLIYCDGINASTLGSFRGSKYINLVLCSPTIQNYSYTPLNTLGDSTGPNTCIVPMDLVSTYATVYKGNWSTKGFIWADDGRLPGDNQGADYCLTRTTYLLYHWNGSTWELVA